MIGDHTRRRPGTSASIPSTLVAVAMLLCWSSRLPGQTPETVTAQSVKAVYLLRFAGYVTWPEGILDDPAEPLIVGVVGDDSLAAELREITVGRKVLGREVVVKRLAADGSLEGINILFVAAAQTAALPRIGDAAREESTLVVSEHPDALELGSVINFRRVDQRIRFEVSLDAAEMSGLWLSSQLLAVAERVETRSN